MTDTFTAFKGLSLWDRRQTSAINIIECKDYGVNTRNSGRTKEKEIQFSWDKRDVVEGFTEETIKPKVLRNRKVRPAGKSVRREGAT